MNNANKGNKFETQNIRQRLNEFSLVEVALKGPDIVVGTDGLTTSERDLIMLSFC